MSDSPQPTQRNVQRPRRWRAHWIWDHGNGRDKNAYYYFRRPFDVRDPARGHRLFITADTRYQLYVNGAFVGRGAPQSQPYFQYYDEYGMDGYLVPGTNCVAVIVNHVGDQPDTRGGFLAELVDRQGRTVLASDGAWRVRRAHAWRADTYYFRMNKCAGYQEHFDARNVPGGWMDADFDDRRWHRAAIISGRTSDRPPAVMPWSRLIPRDIPRMAEQVVQPVRIEAIDECLSIANRLRSDDLSIGLSVVGQPLRHSRVDNAESLCGCDGVAVIQNSTDHLDGVFDGVYDPCIVLDFGKVITGYIRLTVEGPPGASVDIGYAERLIDGHFNNALEGQFADRVILAGGMQTYQPFTWKGFRYAKLRCRDCCEPIRLHAAEAVVTSYPFEERGRFESSDETLNAVFDICRYTIRLCSNECITDTPWREQGQWLGDVAAVTVSGIYACFGDDRLPGKFLRQSAANQLPTGLIGNMTNIISHDWQWVIPDYSLWWVMGLWNHYEYTGRREWIDDFYPHVIKIVQAFLAHIDADGLVADMPHWVFIDWADVDRQGQCAALNAIFYGALESAGHMARLKQDAYAVDLIDRTRNDIRAAFVRQFFDGDRGCFVDANVDGQMSDKVSEHANLAAIRWQLCDDRLAERIAAAFYDQQSVTYTEAQPFFTSVVLQALDRIGRFDLALKIIRDRWGRRMVDRGATSTFEEWGTNGSWRSGQYSGFLRSLSHAWSAHPAEFLIRNLAGLEILEPGCGRVRLRPRKTPFDYRLVFPTPLGPIEAAQVNGKIELAAPENIHVERD